MRRIITVGREFGSGGREIGRRIAEELQIAYYIKMLRHSGSSTQFSLDSYSTTTTGTQPIMDRQDTGSMPDWSKLRYGGVPTNGNVNVFSIDCRPQ